ncbi:PLP-dependent aminotransferase family protein [Clostridium sp. FP1]|uniref:MocR-like pyridoxine biosynthesis transcription factor PdxR n=1 Tax=Clostridium sp. FP1 TaxID=2724076 RepID=UPI0013E982C6|nr:PLP-dependent aminotransferase family protein [Clostridium sp. FP1]MBZ9634748.1 PLP-dependent aminotransferase family protein [Clostridium sp. FP1]
MFVLNNKIDIPLYIQIYGQFKERILSGNLKCGSKLPSTRKLCTDLCISRNTVDTAYHQLYSEGYVISKPRNGYYVQNLDFSSIPVTRERFYTRPALTDNIDNSIQYDFKYGKLSEGELPIREWQRLTNKCLRESKSEMTSYGPTFGEPGLREEILKYLHYHRGVKCTSDQIFIGAGVHYCLGMLCQLIRDTTDTIAMEEPGYHITRSTLRNNGFNVNPISLDSSGINVKELSLTKAKAVYVTPSHQYPLGIIMPISRRLELIEWAIQNNSIIIEDDYSCHLRYNTKPIQSLQSLCSDKVVYIGSFSKFLFPTLRLSYMVVPAPMMDKFRSMFNGYPSSVPFIIQKTLELFMQQGHWERYVRKSNQVQKKKHDTLVETLKKEFTDKISIFGMNAGLHLLVQVKWTMSEDELIERAYRVGVKVYPASKFWKHPNKNLAGAVVLGFGGIELNQIAPAIKLLHKAWLSNCNEY